MKDSNFAGSNTDKLNLSGTINDTKIELIETYFRKIMEVIGLDMDNHSLKDTPRRVAKMYVNELFSGLNENSAPSITLFDNEYNYNQMLVEKDITVISTCEHHFVPIIGKAYVAYFSTGTVIGLSKLNRIVQYFSRRPQLQERLTTQIGREIMSILNTDDVAVFIEAEHFCIKIRGVNELNSKTVTSFYNGKFLQPEVRSEFLSNIKQ